MFPAALNPADNPLSKQFYGLLIHNLGPVVVPLLMALAVAVVVFLPARWLSFRLGAVAQPGGRNIHTFPTPRLGGLALIAGFTVSALLYAVPAGDGDHRALVVVIASAATGLLLTLDDIRPFRARNKFVFQVLLSLAIALSGLSINRVNLGALGALTLAPALAIPVTVLWLVGMQNTMNFLDGVDGLAAGVAAIVAGALLLAAINREAQDHTQVFVVLLCAALIGACLGFLVFNFHPARIFMGDGGAHFLGIALGTLSIYGIAKGAVIFALVVPLAALAVPILDTAWAIVRRRRNRISVAHPDTMHIHHQLLDFGLSQRETCLVFYFATGITACLGLMLFGHRKMLAVGVVLLVVALSTLVGERLSELEQTRQEARRGLAAGEGQGPAALVES
ncbi:MAG: UDP-GlcNAc:undecaprenyl-phosphate/decaprenyl-phosphate GlcNAc-phosphate transferase [Chloroflexota bacterium]|jgi:UDP-GlcNAc:undecaprenyl-phosphate GlcNAc-1-phosphate transferase|nr:UDP-GlcNAc:undecaprenyl-phosphate/decaprenyl-phosphate GlcNAc-phosphate transferase [Chloroflexota bacterium]